MSGPTKHLPIAIGGSLEPGGGSSARAEQITRDPGETRRAADSKPEPKEAVYVPEPEPVPEPVAPEPQVTEPPARVYQDDEIDALHARFDAMESQIKRRLAVATLHARFDALEEWLKARFGE